ncbi:hypothetical protein AeNC1_018984 [Aphanomyces euteiches]|nr:hypothetical protein AeNC1_018984 [Aphanomyces euteiches]
MDIAAQELTEKMALAAYCTFPRGLTSIPAWTTCPTRFQLHRLSYVFNTKTYQEEVLTSYNVTATLDRMRFVVDLFKILKWVCSLDKPNVLMHLFPQVRTKTPNGHYITWLKSGLVKEFREGTEVNMELIQRIYNNTKFLHVERGRCNCTSVTISSIGQTLENSLHYFQGQPKLIFDQVKSALDELHSIGIAHCDVRAANVFVLLEDKRVILGDLEYCRALHDSPPDVKVFPKKKDACKTALELDMYQLGVFQDELGRLMS